MAEMKLTPRSGTRDPDRKSDVDEAATEFYKAATERERAQKKLIDLDVEIRTIELARLKRDEVEFGELQTRAKKLQAQRYVEGGQSTGRNQHRRHRPPSPKTGTPGPERQGGPFNGIRGAKDLSPGAT